MAGGVLLDYVLIVIAGMAMFAQAVLGLLVTTRPPSERRRIWYEIAFIAIGFAGVGAVVWGGVRTDETSNYLRYGVTHIEQMGVASSVLLERQSEMILAQNQLLEEKLANLGPQRAALPSQVKIATALTCSPKVPSI
jgi:hypothetical protein